MNYYLLLQTPKKRRFLQLGEDGLLAVTAYLKATQDKRYTKVVLCCDKEDES